MSQKSEENSRGIPTRDNEKGGTQRNWQLHPGANRFLCGGRFVMSQHSSVFALTVFLICATMTLFCVFDAPFLADKVSIFVPLTASLLFILTMAQLFKTSFSDPGILPRASTREVVERERNEIETYSKTSSDNDHHTEWTQPKNKTVNVCGQPVKLKYCFTCCLFSCPWVANCIGLRNYRHFYLFISLLSILDAVMGASVILHIVMRVCCFVSTIFSILFSVSNEKGTFMAAAREAPVTLLVAAINLLSIWSIMGLSGFHTYLMAVNQTTNEDIKGTFSSKLRPAFLNPYKHKNPIINYCRILCGPEPPSLIASRGIPSSSGEVVTVDVEVLAKMPQHRQLPLHPDMGNNSHYSSTINHNRRSVDICDNSVDIDTGV